MHKKCVNKKYVANPQLTKGLKTVKNDEQIRGGSYEILSEIIPVEPDPDNAGGGRIETICLTLSPRGKRVFL